MFAAKQKEILWLRPIFIALLTIAFCSAFYRTAWISEDAFITFRVIDNALNGYGLRWNIDERVQVYTHPLWFALQLPLVGFFQDPYYVSLGLSFFCFVLAMVILGASAPRPHWSALLALMALLWSRAFIDYASSGLENPLLYALLALFSWLWLMPENNLQRRTVFLFACTSMLVLTRPDAMVFVLPTLFVLVWQLRTEWRGLLPWMLVGLLPLLGWTAFSLLYYGSPVANTAIAKVATGLDLASKAQQALNYLIWTLENDPITAILLTVSVFTGLSTPGHTLRPLALGIVSWGLYLVAVGADYMGGRFFSCAVWFATIINVHALTRRPSRWVASVLFVALLILHDKLSMTVFSPPEFSNPVIASSGIADERGFYYRQLGLLPTLSRGTWESHSWLLEGRVLKQLGGVYTRCAIGMTGFAAGPGVHWLDPLALSEPFLARLPSRENVRVGHYERAFPPGYLESEISDANHLLNPALARLYYDVRLTTRAPLLDAERLGAIWRLNTGHHHISASDFDREAIGLPGMQVVSRAPLSCFGLPYGWDGNWKLSSHRGSLLLSRIAMRN